MTPGGGDQGDRPKLQKAIAHSGLMSRRAAEELIAAGRVTVDGQVAHVGDRVDPSVQKVAIDGKRMPVRPDLVTYLLYKPTGVVSTASDPQGRRTVVDLVPHDPRVYPVGRLDVDSEGLMLLTNDGDLAELVMHPRHGVTKTYLVLVAGGPGPWVERLRSGVDLEDGRAAALSARVVATHRNRTMVEIRMGEGRKREIRRMCETLGHAVLSLVRTAVGPVSDRDLKPGEWRLLNPAEIADLYQAGETG